MRKVSQRKKRKEYVARDSAVDVGFKFESIHPEQDEAWDAIDQHDVAFLTGPAGTAKTFCAVAYAIEAVLSDEAEWIIITRPSVEAGERLGYLPGSGNQKIGPYLQPIYDTIDKLLTPGTKAHTKVKASVQVRPLAYMRGATFDNSIAILDEAQNVTIEQMRLWLSRIGKNTKMIACGDQAQTDLREMSCLVKVAQKLHGLPGVKHFIFSDRAIVRHDLIAPMMDRLAGI